MSKWSISAVLPRPVTKIICSIPASRASSTAYWISGRSITGSISLGIALVACRNRVPSQATGNTALRIVLRMAKVLAADRFASTQPKVDFLLQRRFPLNAADGQDHHPRRQAAFGHDSRLGREELGADA